MKKYIIITALCLASFSGANLHGAESKPEDATSQKASDSQLNPVVNSAADQPDNMTSLEITVLQDFSQLSALSNRIEARKNLLRLVKEDKTRRQQSTAEEDSELAELELQLGKILSATEPMTSMVKNDLIDLNVSPRYDSSNDEEEDSNNTSAAPANANHPLVYDSTFFLTAEYIEELKRQEQAHLELFSTEPDSPLNPVISCAADQPAELIYKDGLYSGIVKFRRTFEQLTSELEAAKTAQAGRLMRKEQDQEADLALANLELMHNESLSKLSSVGTRLRHFTKNTARSLATTKSDNADPNVFPKYDSSSDQNYQPDDFQSQFRNDQDQSSAHDASTANPVSAMQSTTIMSSAVPIDHAAAFRNMEQHFNSRSSKIPNKTAKYKSTTTTVIPTSTPQRTSPPAAPAQPRGSFGRKAACVSLGLGIVGTAYCCKKKIRTTLSKAKENIIERFKLTAPAPATLSPWNTEL